MALQDAVNHPAHYNVGKIEVIDAIEEWKLGFNDGNAVKYIARHRQKGRPVEDLKKALWYIARELMTAHQCTMTEVATIVTGVVKSNMQKELDELMKAHPELFGEGISDRSPVAPFIKGTPLVPATPLVFGTPGSPTPPYISTSDETNEK